MANGAQIHARTQPNFSKEKLKSKEHNQLLELKRLIKAVSGNRQEGAAEELAPELLSTIVSVIALNVLERNECLKNLSSKTESLSHQSAEEISKLNARLYRRAKELAPEAVREVMPEPIAITPHQLTAFKQFFKATKDFPLFAKETAIGHTYQLCSHMRRQDALKQVQSSNKEMSSQALIAFTQLYTPDWVVDALIDHALKRDIVPPCELSVIDPACGGGNFLLPAFDAMLSILESNGFSQTDAAKYLANGALSGVDIDPHGIWITSMAFSIRCLRLDEPQALTFDGLQLLDTKINRESILGTLDRSYDSIDGHPLSRRYSTVLTNPPYIGRKLLSRELKQLLRQHYPDDSHDISVAFTRRCLELLKDEGKLGLITQSSIMYLPSSKAFRNHLIDGYAPTLAIEAGTGVFPLQSGEKIDSVILVVGKARPLQKTIFVNLRKEKDKATALAEALQNPNSSPLTFTRDIKSFRRFPNSQFNYSCPEAAVTLMEKLPPLDEFAEVRQGLATTDNERFVKFVWEVDQEEINKVWFPYVKGAGSQRWFSPVVNVVKWENEGQEIKDAVKKAYPYLNGKVHWVVKNEKYYFREGLSFSFVNNSNFAVRLLPAGCIFDVAASALFPTKIDRYALLAYLNSSFAGKMAHLINPTINFQVGDVKRLPVIPFTEEESAALSKLAIECVEATKLIAQENSTCSSALQASESRIDDFVLSALKQRDILSTQEFAELEAWISRSPLAV